MFAQLCRSANVACEIAVMRMPMAVAAKLATSEQGPREPRVVEAVTAELAAHFGNRLVTSRAVREQHGNTLTWIDNQPPDAVVFPQETADVQTAVRICAKHK